MIKAIIFDCFGVIVSDGLEMFLTDTLKTEPELRHNIRGFVRQANLGIISRNDWRARAAELLNVTTEDFANDIDVREKRNDKLLKYILGLRECYTIALLSNIPKQGIERRFTEEEIVRYFDKIYLSGELGIAKPDEAIYRHAFEDLGYEASECIFIDDMKRNVQAAENVGMKGIVYQLTDDCINKINRLIH